MLRTMGQVFTADVCRQLVTEEVWPHVKDGTVGIEHAHAIVFQRYAVVRLVRSVRKSTRYSERWV